MTQIKYFTVLQNINRLIMIVLMGKLLVPGHWDIITYQGDTILENLLDQSRAGAGDSWQESGNCGVADSSK